MPRGGQGGGQPVSNPGDPPPGGPGGFGGGGGIVAPGPGPWPTPFQGGGNRSPSQPYGSDQQMHAWTMPDGSVAWAPVPQQAWNEQQAGNAPQPPGGPQGTPGGVPGGPQGNQGGNQGQPTNISTSITPQPVYSNDFTQAQGNLQAAMGVPTYSDLLGGQGARGFNSQTSGAIQGGIGSQWGQQMAQAQMAPQQVAQQHQFANMQQMLMGQAARDREAQGWGGLSVQQQGFDNQMQRMQQNTIMGMLGTNPWWT